MISNSTNYGLTNSVSLSHLPPVACQDVVCHIPGAEAREQQKQLIHQAVKEGRLFFREINLNSEASYLGSTKKYPRPFYGVWQGVSVQVRSSKPTVGTTVLKTLACYKRNAYTCSLMNVTTKPDELKVKCLPDLRSLQAKMAEQAARAWEIYPAFTSGHLHSDGTYRPPKLKQHQYSGLLQHSEVLSSGYEAEQINCVCINKDDTSGNISDALQEKQSLEKTLGIASLPLVVYSSKGGTTEVYFDDELTGSNLAVNEARLGAFSSYHNVSESTLRGLLNLLPMSLKSATLNSPNLKISPDLVAARQEFLQLVKKPDWLSYQRFQALKERRFVLHSQFYENGKWRTPLDLLSIYEVRRWRLRDGLSSGVAEQLFVELLRSGVTISDAVCKDVLEICHPAWLVCYVRALNFSSDRKTVRFLVTRDFPSSPAVTLEFHQYCEKATPDQLTDLFLEIFQMPFCTGYRFSHFDHPLLALFCYFTPDEAAYKKLEKIFHNDYNELYFKKRLGIFSVKDCIRWVEGVWQNREQAPFYQNWSDLVQQARQQITDLPARNGLYAQSPPVKGPTGNEPTELQLLVDAFSVPPVLPAAGDNEATILAVLNHYYRRPGPERVISSLYLHALPEIWKPTNACNHVLRVRINALWYMELLEKFNVMTFSDSEKELLALAAIYHDAAAEDVPKAEEESKAAFYFKRDLAGHYPAQLLDDIAMALAGKEDDLPGCQPLAKPVSEKLRNYLHVLRFADRLDIIRCTGVPADFSGPAKAGATGFDASRLDLPVQEQFDTNPDRKSDFQLELEAAMHGAADLVQVTGHLASDGRAVPYVSAYRLEPDSKRLNVQFEWTPTPRQKMDGFVDNNVRRKIARQAGLNTCLTAEHEHCRTDTQNGRTWGIHNSWHDLNQVRIPARMTLLEKMQFEHNEQLLSQATRDEIQKEAERLRCQGIPMQLGTLTQTTLKSPAAKRELENRGITVASVVRLRGYKDDGQPREENMLVPVYTGSDAGHHDDISRL